MSAPVIEAASDAALLAACAHFREADARQDAMNAKPGWDEAEMQDVLGEWWGALEEVERHQPRTKEGLAAKASVAVKAVFATAFMKDTPWREQVGAEMRVALDCLRQMAGAQA